MCRVFMIPHIKPGNLEKTQEFVTKMATELSYHEPDGVGYASITRDGRIFGEKWVNKSDAFKIHSNPDPDQIVLRMQNTFGNAAVFKTQPKVQGTVYGQFGDLKLREEATAVILHARKKTIGDLCVENTHPFFYYGDPDTDGDMDTALIHNGSIANHAALTKHTSTCDSETILNEYIGLSMNYNPWGISDLAKTLYGEYAVGVLSSTYDNDQMFPILDVFKSGKELFVGWIPELETYAFCTSDFNMNSGARSCGLTVEHMMEVKDGAYLRFNCLTGERSMEILEFKPSKKAADYRSENSHHRPNHIQSCQLPARQNDKDETSEDVRRNFEANHPTVFTQQYHQPGVLTPAEQDYFEMLKNNGATDHRALRLVAAATGN